jgi:hypothetical protein
MMKYLGIYVSDGAHAEYIRTLHRSFFCKIANQQGSPFVDNNELIVTIADDSAYNCDTNFDENDTSLEYANNFSLEIVDKVEEEDTLHDDSIGVWMTITRN